VLTKLAKKEKRYGGTIDDKQQAFAFGDYNKSKTMLICSK
jgi:hypothetical protein